MLLLCKAAKPLLLSNGLVTVLFSQTDSSIPSSIEMRSPHSARASLEKVMVRVPSRTLKSSSRFLGNAY